MKRTCVLGAMVMLLALPMTASGQIMRGMGRITGSVRDDRGTPVADVAITATLKGVKGEIAAKTDDKGLWAVYGMGKGEWHVEFYKTGYAPTAARVNLEA